MKGLLLLFIAFTASFALPTKSQAQIVYRQQPYALDTVYPFNIPLLDMDSAVTYNTKEVLAQPPEGIQQPIVVAFWLTTCRPCHLELSTYAANYARWKEQANFRLLAISIDFPHRFRDIARIAQQYNFPFEVYWDVHRLFRSVMPGGLNGLPQVFIFDKKGALAYYHKGFLPGDEQELFKKILELQ